MEQKIKLTALQELFKDKDKYLLNTEKGHTGIPDDGSYHGVQGEYNETFKYFRHPDMPEHIFMRETWQSDSYGESDKLTLTEFVEGKEKIIKVFEPIK